MATFVSRVELGQKIYFGDNGQFSGTVYSVRFLKDKLLFDVILDREGINVTVDSSEITGAETTLQIPQDFPSTVEIEG